MIHFWGEVAENKHYPKKSFKEKIFDIEFRTKKFARTYVYLPLRVELMGSKDDMV